MDTGYPYASFLSRLLANPGPCGFSEPGCGPNLVGRSNIFLRRLYSRLARLASHLPYAFASSSDSDVSLIESVSASWIGVIFLPLLGSPVVVSGSFGLVAGSPMTVARFGYPS